MEYLLFSGAQNTGKTSSIVKYKNLLISKYGYTETIIDKHNCFIIENSDKRILVYPHTDTPYLIDGLVKHLSVEQVNYVITACRSVGDTERDYLINALKIHDQFLEIPLGRMVRGAKRTNAVRWYLNSVLVVAEIIGKTAPFNF